MFKNMSKSYLKKIIRVPHPLSIEVGKIKIKFSCFISICCTAFKGLQLTNVYKYSVNDA